MEIEAENKISPESFGISMKEYHRRYNPFNTERQAMFEQETAILRDQGSPPIVANELVKLRQRVAALEAESVAQFQRIQKLEDSLRTFVRGLEQLPFLL